jgi:two-component system, OmpR family, phosphate regulon sensor histidine kinase PhoR
MLCIATMTTPPDWFNILTDGIILIKNNRVEEMNTAALEFMGISAFFKGQPLITVVRDHRIEQAFLEQRVTQVEKSGRTLLITPFKDGLLIRNMSEIKEAQQDTRELLAVLSHELRTPVATIQATLEALQNDIPKALEKKFLSRANDEAQRLVRLLEDLTVDVRPPDYRRIFLPDVVARVAALVQQTLSENHVELITQIEPLTVWADSDKLMQVMINLLENAAIHGPKYQTISLKAYPYNDTLAYVVVQDRGKPLPENDFEPLFKPHARGASVKTKGTGLGLYIVRNIAEKWQGTAWGKPLADGNEFGFSVQIR